MQVRPPRSVLCHDPSTARRLFAALEEPLAARLVIEEAFPFQPGIIVSTVASAKGLEFDYVVLPDVNSDAYPDHPLHRRRLHRRRLQGSVQGRRAS